MWVGDAASSFASFRSCCCRNVPSWTFARRVSARPVSSAGYAAVPQTLSFVHVARLCLMRVLRFPRARASNSFASARSPRSSDASGSSDAKMLFALRFVVEEPAPPVADGVHDEQAVQIVTLRRTVHVAELLPTTLLRPKKVRATFGWLTKAAPGDTWGCAVDALLLPCSIALCTWDNRNLAID